MQHASRYFVGLLLALAALHVHALQIGDRFEPRTLEQVVGQDESLTIPQEETIFVVEFWATWCGPCRVSIPHLDELQQQYRDSNVVIVGVSDEDEATVTGFLDSEHEDLSYTIALDPDDAMWNALATPFGVEGIPHAFVIDGDGHILWSGHPMQGLDTVLAQVTDGSFDSEAAQAFAREQRAQVEQERILALRIEEYLIRAESDANSEEAQALAEWIQEQAAEHPQACANAAWAMLQEVAGEGMGEGEPWVFAAAFNPDGSRIVTGTMDDSARIYNASNGESVAVLRGHSSSVLDASFSPNGQRVLTASEDGTARIWNPDTGTVEQVLGGHATAVNAAAFSPDGARVVTGAGDSTARVWDVETGEELLVLNGHEDWLRAVAFSPDGAHIVTGADDNTARLWDANTGEASWVLRGHEDWVRAVAFSPDGNYIVTGADDSTARVWDARTSEELHVLEGHSDWVRGVAFSPDGTRIVTASDDLTARVWSRESGEELLVLEGHTDWVRDVNYSPDGAHILTASDDGTARLWDAASGDEVLVIGADEGITVAAPEPIPTDHFAVELARLSYEASEGAVPDIGDTYAFALFASGQLAEAVELQRAVVAAEPDDEGYQIRLEMYEAALAQP